MKKLKKSTVGILIATMLFSNVQALSVYANEKEKSGINKQLGKNEGEDITAPEFKGISIDKKVVRPGDKVTISIDMVDGESGIDLDEGVYIEIGAENSNQLAGPEVVYNEESKKYEFTIEIDGTMPNGIYSISEIFVCDNAGNGASFGVYGENPTDLSDANFEVVDSINEYQDLIKIVTIDKKQPRPEDIINISVELASNSYIGALEIPYKNSDKENSVKLKYNKSTNRYEGSLTIDSNTELGIWCPEYIEFTSNSGKWITILDVEYYGLRDKFKFEVITGGWVYKNEKWYYYNKNGEMQKGWLSLDGTWYYLRSNGEMAVGWELVGDKWYYLDGSGAMKTGWLDLNGTWYYIRSNGEMAVGWEVIGDKWYYLDGSGAMKIGWLNVDGTWYYLRSNGVMATGWELVNGTWYYMYNTGQMATNTIIDGWSIDSNGVATLIK